MYNNKHTFKVIKREIFFFTRFTSVEGAQQRGTLVHFHYFEKKREKHNFWQFSKYIDYSCKKEQDMFENSEFGRFCHGFTA